MKEQVKQLWKTCFDDTDEFVEMYMDRKYSEEVSLTIQDAGGNVVSAMQALPYPMTFCGGEIMTSYISGACTHPNHRSEGLMKQLLQKGFGKMWEGNIPLSTLIPAGARLFDYYRQSGYTAVFHYSQTTQEVAALRAAAGREEVYSGIGFDEKAYRFLDRRMKQRPCCVQHTEDDYRIILEDLSISGGTTLFTRDGNGEITALALVLPEGETLRANEIIADSLQLVDSLLLKGCEIYGCRKATASGPVRDGLSYPLGMARIINAETILRIYAAHYPEREVNICLRDGQIPLNDGYYHISSGKCFRENKSGTAPCQEMTAGELTDYIFLPEEPYMSLMLN